MLESSPLFLFSFEQFAIWLSKAFHTSSFRGMLLTNLGSFRDLQINTFDYSIAYPGTAIFCSSDHKSWSADCDWCPLVINPQTTVRFCWKSSGDTDGNTQQLSMFLRVIGVLISHQNFNHLWQYILITTDKGPLLSPFNTLQKR